MYNTSLLLMFLPLILITSLWSAFWKGLGLWRAARNGNVVWFVVMMFVNTLGILEMIYIFGVAKVKIENLFKK